MRNGHLLAIIIAGVALTCDAGIVSLLVGALIGFLLTTTHEKYLFRDH